MVGDDVVGEMLSSPLIDDSGNWGGLRLMDYSLAQTAFELSQSRIWLPGCPSALEMNTALLGDVGKLGTYDLDITGSPPRGPFTKGPSSPTATYPSLWNHNAKNETRIVCVPDSQLRVRQGMKKKRPRFGATASRSHVNRDFTFGSQALAVAFTERKSIGGRVWPTRFSTTNGSTTHFLFGQQHARTAVILVAFQPPTVQQGNHHHPLCRVPPGSRLPNPDRRPVIHRRIHFR